MNEVNQQAIADILNISRATVSRCFTNHPGINPITRAKVFKVALEINYKHSEARGNTSKRDKKRANISVLICSDEEEYSKKDYQNPGEQILAGITEYAVLNNAKIDVDLIPPEATHLDHPKIKLLHSLNRHKTDGILLIYPFSESIINELSSRFPVVSLVDQLEQSTMDCVDVDHYIGISEITDYLVANGHRRIGFYTRDYPIEAGWSYRRYSAFIEKMTRLKLQVSHTDIIGIFPRSEKTVEQSLDEVAARTRQGVTAWVCAADHQAYDLIEGMKERGLEVPRDVSITGFDGIEKSDDSLALTTINIPFREIGIAGIERLAARLRKRFHESRHVYISGSLEKGKTVAKPRVL